jgi:glycosyltransferase involved in cell wall biosynthesis
VSAVPPSGEKCTVSVVVPLYNTEKYIAECIDSVLNQTLKNVEILVVDDGSSDGSAAIVKEIARQDGRVRLLQHPDGVNQGVSRTRRLGIMEATGQYIAYLDADDAFDPTKLERQVRLLQDHPSCLLCHTGVNAITVPVEDREQSRLIDFQAQSYTNGWNNFRPEITEYSFLDRHEALRANAICNSSVLVAADAVRSATAASRQLFQYEDFAQWALLATKGPFVYTPERLTFYRVHSESSSFSIHGRNFLKHLYAMIEFLLTVHVLTQDSGLRIRVESELLYILSRIMEVYAERGTGEDADSLPESPPLTGTIAESLWEQPAIELQAQVYNLREEVFALSERLAAIRSSRVYRSLVKVRNLLNRFKAATIG